MGEILRNVALILVFMLVNAVFAAAEMSLVSLRDTQVHQLSTRGKRGRAVAQLTSQPNRFLSAVSIAITLSGFLSAAVGEATLSEHLVPVYERWGMSTGVADIVSLITITVCISYFTIVIAELTSKRLAMQRAPAFALALAPLVALLANLARPVIWFLGVSTNVAVRLLGGDPSASRSTVTDEEIRAMVTNSSTLGIEERQIVDDVFAAGQRSLREVMVPRTEVKFLDGSTPAHRAIRDLQGEPHSRYPVFVSTVDEIAGFLHVRDLMDLDPAARNSPVSRLVRPVTFLPDTVKVLRALTELRRTTSHLAVVRDEYGGTAGIVTLEDLVEELVGDIRDEYDVESEAIITLEGAADVDGLITLEEFAERTGLTLPEGPYDTLAGYWVAQRGRLPELGDTIDVELTRDDDLAADPVGISMAVTELDGRRASRITVRLAPPDTAAESGTTPLAE